MDVLDRGKGAVFTDPDPDKLRAFFQKKSRIKKDKTMTLKQAVETFVNDGDYLAIGGFGANRTPVAACHEIVRQGKKNLGFAGHTATHDMQILSAGKAFSKLDIAYIVGLEARGLSGCSRKYVESGDVEVSEWTNYALSIRLQAAAMGVPYLPMRSMLGTDTFKFSGAVAADCPFTGKKMALVPALSPDVTFIHVHEADIYGNARFEGIAVADLELANASKKLIITCERIVHHDEIAREPHKTQIPYFIVDAVVEVPYGAYPGTMPNEYFSDEAHLKEWMTKEKDPEAFEAFLKEIIFDCEDFNAYIDRNGGLDKMRQLRRTEFLTNGEGE
ncbi:MAG: CoA transferase subunit A [Desulfobacterales bacterium]|nr:CoA transferase subunit A [Desulfobacterales bacterium]